MLARRKYRVLRRMIAWQVKRSYFRMLGQIFRLGRRADGSTHSPALLESSEKNLEANETCGASHKKE